MFLTTMREREKIFGYLCVRQTCGRSFPPTWLHFHWDLRCSWFISIAVNCTHLKTSNIESLIFNFGSTVWYIWWEIIQIVFLKVWSYLQRIGAICDLGGHEQISVIEGEAIVPDDRVSYVRISLLREKNIQKLLLQLHNTEQILMSIWHEKNKSFCA